MTTTPALNSVETKKWITPFDVNYNTTKKLWNKETSENCVIALAQKVVYFVGAAFTAVLETLRNLLAIAGNGGIRVANGVHSYFADRKVEEAKGGEKPVETTITATVQQQTRVESPKTVAKTELKIIVVANELSRTEKAKAWANWAATPAYKAAGFMNKYVVQSIAHPKVAFQNVKSWYNTAAVRA